MKTLKLEEKIFQELLDLLGIESQRNELYFQALTHKSYCREREFRLSLESYERLEFLGDSILSFYVGQYIFRKFPEHSEGDLSKIRSNIVQGSSLYKAALKLNLQKFVKISVNLQNNKKYKLPLDDVYEAIVGAIFLDKGLDVVGEFVERTLLSEYDFSVERRNYKSELQEWVQKKWKRNLIEYKLVQSFGPDNDKSFAVELWIDGKKIAIGISSSIKKAETVAAKMALEGIDYE